MKYILNIAVNIPLFQVFSYYCDQRLNRGVRVLVPFGVRQLVGVVWQNQVDVNSLNIELDQLKDVITILDHEIASDVLAIVNFAASYYCYPIGQTLFCALPIRLRKNTTMPKILQTKLQHISTSCAFLNTVTLSVEQHSVISQILSHSGKFHPAVLHGITGSGKTEIYIQLIAHCIAHNQQALVLIPEISLTPLLLDKFQSRFPETAIGLITSGVSETESVSNYMLAAAGLIKIIIGTRISIFTPFKSLGIIIVDEEHDGSFKQNDTLRYNARDLAVWRAKYHEIPIVLGSATPSLETLANCDSNKYITYKLTQRIIKNAVLPAMKIIHADSKIDAVHDSIKTAIAHRLTSHEISLIFINRRGFAPVALCDACGHIMECKNCSVNLVYHKTTHQLKCHHCAFTAKYYPVCPKCKLGELTLIGEGTQKLEEQLSQLFPKARIKRIDQDNINKSHWQELYNAINNNEVDILVGTQMLSKGHDFHNITLVVAINIDNGLYSYDFRSTEHLFMQLMQVSGRAGRGQKPGEVLLQTKYPDHFLYKYLIQHDYDGFSAYLLKLRAKFNLPPYIHYVIIRAQAKSIKLVMKFLDSVYLELSNHNTSINIYAPVTACIQKLNQYERGQILIHSASRIVLHKLFPQILSALHKHKRYNITWYIDVDPLDI